MKKNVLPNTDLGKKVRKDVYFNVEKSVLFVFDLDKEGGGILSYPEKCLIDYLNKRTRFQMVVIVFVTSVFGTTGDYHIVEGVDKNLNHLTGMSKLELMDRYFWKDLPYKYTIRDIRIGTDRKFILPL